PDLRLSALSTLSLHDALPILPLEILKTAPAFFGDWTESWSDAEVLKMLQNYYLFCSLVLFVFLLIWRWLAARIYQSAVLKVLERDRKSTRLNSSHVAISYAVF